MQWMEPGWLSAHLADALLLESGFSMLARPPECPQEVSFPAFVSQMFVANVNLQPVNLLLEGGVLGQNSCRNKYASRGCCWLMEDFIAIKNT